VPLFVLGTLILFAADRLDLLRSLERAAEPLLAGALGLPRETAEAFVVGFLRRDFGAAGLYRLANAGRLDAVQVVVAVTTMTLFIPCIANFLVIVKERGWRTGLAVASFVFPFALGIGAALNAVLRAAPGILE
jgi:ferrous iron transport protein B